MSENRQNAVPRFAKGAAATAQLLLNAMNRCGSAQKSMSGTAAVGGSRAWMYGKSSGAMAGRPARKTESLYVNIKRHLIDTLPQNENKSKIYHDFSMIEHVAEEFATFLSVTNTSDDAGEAQIIHEIACTLIMVMVEFPMDACDSKQLGYKIETLLNKYFSHLPGNTNVVKRANQAVSALMRDLGGAYPIKEALRKGRSELGIEEEDVMAKKTSSRREDMYRERKEDKGKVKKITVIEQCLMDCVAGASTSYMGDNMMGTKGNDEKKHCTEQYFITHDQFIRDNDLPTMPIPAHVRKSAGKSVHLNSPVVGGAGKPFALLDDLSHVMPQSSAQPEPSTDGFDTAVDFDPTGANIDLAAVTNVDFLRLADISRTAEAGFGGRATGGPQETGKRWKLSFPGLIDEIASMMPDTYNIVLHQLLVTLGSSRTNDDIQNELLDNLGYERMELLMHIIQGRNELVDEYRRQLLTLKTYDELTMLTSTGSKKKRAKKEQQFSSYNQTALEREVSRAVQRQERQKANNGKSGGANFGDYVDDMIDIEEQRRLDLEDARLNAVNLDALRDAQEAAWTSYNGVIVKCKHVYDQQTKRRGVNVHNLVLPVGTERVEHREWDRITIPAQTSTDDPQIAAMGDLIKVSELDQIGLAAFAGLKTLNRIQSTVYKQAYETSENLLICAPTGAGKTNIAMLTVLEVVRRHWRGGDVKNIEKDKFKIIYVAPMKALATEMTRSFGQRLAPLGIVVKELTGDTHLTKNEILNTQMLVVTPEKWDVVTRKGGSGDTELTDKVELIIIDEVHLLHDDRGPVIETIVARTLRQVNMRQKPIRIVGLSATLPNYMDVARFLDVNMETSLFFFDGRFRPVPLQQTFIGVKSGPINEKTGKSSQSPMEMLRQMDNVVFKRMAEFVKAGHQVLCFVHARNATGKLATSMRDMAQMDGELLAALRQESSGPLQSARNNIAKSRNAQLKMLFGDGFGIHHAGMLRPDRILVERYFSAGYIRVLCCTSTLAWGVNLPAHAVIIRGTDVYDAKHGSYQDLGILDVQQIFGRAGRPQFDTMGSGTIVTTHEKMYKYVAALMRQTPIESQFINRLSDNLNAEIVLGTVANMEEAIAWLDYTYLMVRARLNPLAYAIKHAERADDPELFKYRRMLIEKAALQLDRYEMIRYNMESGTMQSTDTGRLASHFYVASDTVEIIIHGDQHTILKEHMTYSEILNLICHAKEFAELKIRDDEMEELDQLACDACALPVKGGLAQVQGKVNVLLQSQITRVRFISFSLNSDAAYVDQNAARIARCLFEMALRKSMTDAAANLLIICRCIERRQWYDAHPIRQVADTLGIPNGIVMELERKRMSFNDNLRDMRPEELNGIFRGMGGRMWEAIHSMPFLEVVVDCHPLTGTIIRLTLTITPSFTWNDRVHGRGAEHFYIWIDNLDENYLYHWEQLQISRKQAQSGEPQTMTIMVPVNDTSIKGQWALRVLSDRWLGIDQVQHLSFAHLIMPSKHTPHTDLLPLRPLSTTALQNDAYRRLYSFDHFNAVQTQIFHCLYHTDRNVLLGAPTGSGKTVAAELAMFRVFNNYPKDGKVVYIAPMKALVRERMKDWKVKIEQKLGKTVVELTGDVTPDLLALQRASVIVTTPEKWDGISRQWCNRSYVRQVKCVIIDEIHLLGEDRGPVLEVVVARMNYMRAAIADYNVRVVGLSTALANAGDLGLWLGIEQQGLYNFRPGVRPVPCTVHVSGFPGKHYCPRMATMNKPAYMAIRNYSAHKPVLIFVSSRRQTRLTGLDLIPLLLSDGDTGRWVHMDGGELNTIISTLTDTHLKQLLAFGIGMHHAGLNAHDRETVEHLFANGSIQVLIATATLAWGVNFPAHLVIVKGTEFFDKKTCRYVDMPVTDVLQMIGRAGRPQFDDSAVACVFVLDIKKPFYKKFLYDPFPVESQLLKVLTEHFNAEIVAGNITSKQDAMVYLTWTYFFRRLQQNPSYYGLENNTDDDALNVFLSLVVELHVTRLVDAACVEVAEDGVSIQSLFLGRTASHYYLTVRTVAMLNERMADGMTPDDVLLLMTELPEYDEVPVRHNEELINANLARECPIQVDRTRYDDPHIKAHLLLQCHMCRMAPPHTDYATDTKSVLDQCIRILQAMLDLSVESMWLSTSLSIVRLQQGLLQARWPSDPPLSTLRGMGTHNCNMFSSKNIQISTLPHLQQLFEREGSRVLYKRSEGQIAERHIGDIERLLLLLPKLALVSSTVRGRFGAASTNCKPLLTCGVGESRTIDQHTELHAGEEYVFTLKLQRQNKKPYTGSTMTPGFVKQKEEAWYAMVGAQDHQERTGGVGGLLVVMKRVMWPKGRASTGGVTGGSYTLPLPLTLAVNLLVRTPPFTGSQSHDVQRMSLYLLSDTYMGIDQQYDLCVKLIPPLDAIVDE